MFAEAKYRLARTHCRWDQSISPQVTVEPGEVVVFETEAFALCSVAVDLRVSEVVDTPNWIISALLPLDIFE